MTLDDFDKLMMIAGEQFQRAREIERTADALELLAMRMAGTEHVSRDPGFPCWRIDGVPGWFNTAREALEAKLKQEDR